MSHAVYRPAGCLQSAAGSVAAGISPSVVEHAVHWALSELRLQGDASAARQQHVLGQTIKAAKVNNREDPFSEMSTGQQVFKRLDGCAQLLIRTGAAAALM